MRTWNKQRMRDGLVLSCAGLLAGLPMVAGCGAFDELLDELIGRGRTRVELVNNGEYIVDVEVYISDEEDIPRELLTEFGDREELSVSPGETRLLPFRRCDNLQAITIDGASLRVIGDVGPEADSEVLREGSDEDFDCGDVITFTFDHSDVIVDFEVTAEIRRR